MKTWKNEEGENTGGNAASLGQLPNPKVAHVRLKKGKDDTDDLKESIAAVRQLMDEAVFKIFNSDLQHFYKGVERDIRKLNEALKSGDRQWASDYINILLKTHRPFESDSSVLRSPACKEAHEKNPIRIQVNLLAGADLGYLPNKKLVVAGTPKALLLNLARNISSFEWKAGPDTSGRFSSRKMKKDKVTGEKKFVGYERPERGYGGSRDFYSDTRIRSIINEFNPHSIMANVSAGLTLWLDDTLHNDFISKAAAKSSSDMQAALRGGRESVGIGPAAINSQIHMIDAFRKSIGNSKFRRMRFETLLQRLPALQRSYDIYGDEWKALIVKRMAREKMILSDIG